MLHIALQLVYRKHIPPLFNTICKVTPAKLLVTHAGCYYADWVKKETQNKTNTLSYF